ncbi:MAG TPA: ROK family protein [Gaiellales bacterium]|jgi:glucokinase|nr:ROK family protein [Gaiellales bacterium]
MTRAIGIDVGGTKIAAGVVDTATGVVEARFERGTRPEREPSAILADCVALAVRLAAGETGIPIGLGVCELVDREGRTQSAQTIDWRDRDLTQAFTQLGPTVVESDVRAAAVAEAAFGGGRGVDELLFVIVGTGISSCLVLAGQAYAGAHGNAICFGAPPVEDVASGLALAAAGGRERAEEVLADASLDGLVETAAAGLGAGLAWLVNALDPGAVVLGGGLGLVDRYRELAAAAMRPMIFADNSRDVPVVPAQLGADAGVIGAALAAVRSH